MSVTSGDIKVYGCANMQDTDVGTVGGAINTGLLMIFDNATLANAPGGNGQLSYTSTWAGDTTNISITGRNTGGSIVGQTNAMSGLSIASGTQIWERILKIDVPNHSGIITVKDQAGSTITTIPSGVTQVRRPFYNVSSDIAGGSTKQYYEKVFLRNNNITLNLLEVNVYELTGGLASSVSWALDLVQNGTTTATNRRTAPAAGIGAWVTDQTISGIPGGDLNAGSGLGVWLNLTLTAGAAATKDIYTLAVSGSTI